MARRHTFTRTVVARAPTPTIRISAPAPLARRAGRRARRYARAAGGAALAEKHTLIAVGGAALLGYAEKEKWAIPSILGLSPAASAGLISWAIGKWGRSRVASHLATGLLSVAANRWASGAKVSGVGGVGVMFDDDED